MSMIRDFLPASPAREGFCEFFHKPFPHGRGWCSFLLFFFALISPVSAQDNPFWHTEWDQALAEAKRLNRPLFAVLH